MTLASPLPLLRRGTGCGLLLAGLAALAVRLLASGQGWVVHPLALLAMLALAVELWHCPQWTARLADRLAFLLALPLLAAPASGFALLAALPLGLIAWRQGGSGRPAAALLVGLAFWALQDGAAGQMLAGPIINAEVQGLNALLHALGLPATPDGAALALAGDRTLLVLRGCSLAGLLFPMLVGALAARRLWLPDEARPRLAALLLPLGLAALMNALRLGSMAIWPEAHALLHDPLGLTLLEVAFTLPVAAALLPATGQVVRRPAAAPLAERLPGALATLAACAVLSCGLAIQPPAGATTQAEASHPLAMRGFTLAASRPLTPEGRLEFTRWEDAQGCRVYAAAFDHPAEILPLLRARLRPEAFASWRWWLGEAPQPAESATMVTFRRFAAKLTTGQTPPALFLADPSGCLATVNG